MGFGVRLSGPPTLTTLRTARSSEAQSLPVCVKNDGAPPQCGEKLQHM